MTEIHCMGHSLSNSTHLVISVGCGAVHLSNRVMIFPGKLAKSTRIPCSFFKDWKSSSLTSNECRKNKSLSLDICIRKIWKHNGNWETTRTTVKVRRNAPLNCGYASHDQSIFWKWTPRFDPPCQEPSKRLVQVAKKGSEHSGDQILFQRPWKDHPDRERAAFSILQLTNLNCKCTVWYWKCEHRIHGDLDF